MVHEDPATSARDPHPVTRRPAAAGARSGGVQSIERAFAVLETVVAHDGVTSLSSIAAATGLPLPTIHRVARTLMDLGYLRQEPSRQYTLGPRVMLLAESTPTMLGSVARPHLEQLVDELGETANLAALDGDQIVYIAQVPSRHSMRMFTEVGRRVQPHCTAVGKAILATMPGDQVTAILRRTGMPSYTPYTITTVPDFHRQLALAAETGYAHDDGEQEVGVRCVAVPVPGVTTRLALSISGPAGRMTSTAIAHAIPSLVAAGAALAGELNTSAA